MSVEQITGYLRPRSRQSKDSTSRSSGTYIDPSYGGTGWTYGKTTLAYTGFQTTWSEGHPYHLLGKEKGNNIGGAFRTEKRYMTLHLGGKEILPSQMPRVKALSGLVEPIRYSGEGPALARALPTTLASYPPTMESSLNDLYVAGATAIARCNPTKSAANLAQALIETKRDGLPALPGKKFIAGAREDDSFWKGLQRASDEYLNFQFGTVPLYQDLVQVYKAIAKSGEIWDQYQRDAGRWVRRNYRFPLETTTEMLQPPSQKADPLGFATSCYRSYMGTYTVERVVQRDRWFSGAFTYALPDKTGFPPLDAFSEMAAQARKVLGASFDPATLWKVTPWSWFVDWFVNAGEVISNLSSGLFDKLVMPYGYIMEHVVTTDIHRLTGIEYRAGSQGPSERVMCLVTETKQRYAATPYGFGLDWNGFSPTQLAILASLGISKGGSAVPHVR